MTAFDFGVNCVAMGVGERVGMGVNVGEGRGVNVLVGKLAADEGVGVDEVKSGKSQAMINRAHISKRITRGFLMVFPLADNPISVIQQMQ